jgi:ankyrin repeat protein
MAGSLPIVREMVERGANLSARYDPADKIPDPVKPITLLRRNQTIMHIAALGGSAPIIEYLYSKGARLDLKNAEGETPWDLADHQERYREAIERQNAEGDSNRLKTVVRQTAATDAVKKLLDQPARQVSSSTPVARN